MNSEKSNPQERDKRVYEAPELIEHGAVEEITGTGYTDNPIYGCSGKTYG